MMSKTAKSEAESKPRLSADASNSDVTPRNSKEICVQVNSDAAEKLTRNSEGTEEAQEDGGILGWLAVLGG